MAAITTNVEIGRELRTAARHTAVPSKQLNWARTAILGVLLAAFSIEIVARWVKHTWPQYPVLDGLVSTLAVFTVLSPGLYLIFHLRNAVALRYMMVAGYVLLLGSELVQVSDDLAFIDTWPLFGREGFGHDAARWIFLAVGLVFLLASLYFALVTTIHAEYSLTHERIELTNEVERRKRLADALIEQDNVYRAAITQAGAIPYRIDWANRKYTFYDDQIYKLTGLEPDDLTFERLQTMGDDTRYIGPLAGIPVEDVCNLIKNRAVRNWHREYKIRSQTGQDKWVSDSSVEVVSTSGLVVETVGLMIDITERHREDESIQRNERYFRALTENAQDLTTVLNLDGSIRYESPSITAILGYGPDELIGRNVVEFVHPDDQAHVLRSFMDGLSNPGSAYRAEFRCLHKDGSWHKLESIGRRVPIDSEFDGAVINSRDVTDRESLERQLVQSQKMEGIGRLAGGVAHDFNNMLTAIMGYCEFALEDAEDGGELKGQIEQIMLASTRAADLTRQLLAFARKQITEPRNVDINALTKNLDKLFRRLIGEDIELKTCISPDSPVAYVDPGQFEQVLVNLVVNARDAMPRGGKLTIEIATAVLDSEYAAYHPDVVQGDYVMLAVSDTGSGMTEEVRSRIFEPFFTTKEDGKGTGLGLATCYGIVKQVGGHIWVYSEVGRGTTFKVYLPRVHEAATKLADARIARPVQGGHETILLVEDEALVRAIAVQTLVERGYNVLEAPGGQDAIKIAAEFDGEIHLLVTDVVMPRMSGLQIAEDIKIRRSNLNVLYMSGYTEDAIIHHSDLDRGIAFIPKPFTPDALSRKVRSVLDHEHAADVARA